MAQRRFTPACRWLIEQRPDLLRELPRETPESMFVVLGYSEELGIGRIRLEVPDNLRVYQLTKNLSREAEILFVAPEDLYANAYASEVKKNKFGGLNQFRNVARVFDCPWASHLDSSILLFKVYQGKEVELPGFYGSPGFAELPHPLLKLR